MRFSTTTALLCLSFLTLTRSENNFGWNIFEKFISDKKIISSNGLQSLYAQRPAEEPAAAEAEAKLGPFQSMFPGSVSNPPHLTEEQVGKPLILTPFLENGQIDEARNRAEVRGISDIKTFSGFFTVNKTYDSNLFFWYAPSKVS